MDFGSIRDSCLFEQMACSSELQEIVSCVPKLVVLNRTSRVTLLLKLQSSNTPRPAGYMINITGIASISFSLIILLHILSPYFFIISQRNEGLLEGSYPGTVHGDGPE